MKNKKAIKPLPDCLDGPTIEAVAANTQLFPSGKVAVPKGKRVVLEFTNSMVSVHDPDKPPAFSRTKLGPIMYTHQFLPSDPACRGLSVDTVKENGIVSRQMSYLLLRLHRTNKEVVCWFCGRVWKVGVSKKFEEEHIKQHQEEGTK
jgi:hypothetical protein